MAQVRVRLRAPPQAVVVALSRRRSFRTWESLVFRVLRAHEIAGSNPAVLTFLRWGLCWYGRRLLSVTSQVRFLPPQLTGLSFVSGPWSFVGNALSSRRTNDNWTKDQ